MSKICPSCSKPLDGPDPFTCPHCHIDIPTFVKANLENLRKSKDFLTGYKDRLDAEIERKVKAKIGKHIAIVIGVCLLGLLGIYLKNRSITAGIVDQNISRQLAGPRMQQTLDALAKSKTEEVVRNEISADIQHARQAAQKEATDFVSYLAQTREQLGKEYGELAQEMALVKERNRLARLANVAIADGTRSAFNELQSVCRQPANVGLCEIARAEIMRVVAYYATKPGIKDMPVAYSSADAIQIVDDKISTDELAAQMLNNPQWQVRAKFAHLLHSRKERGVAEALLKTAENDTHLEVVKAALESFSELTGYKTQDILDYESAKQWWQSQSGSKQ